ncbi:MAG TPA: hypothetical protein VFK58_07185 [Sphingomicrobium sp.]|nr:hypothetical protein [Sphingomicrobium sp.]
MDLNYLYYRHQVSVFMSLNAACTRSRNAHSGLADGYARRIAAVRGDPIESMPAIAHAGAVAAKDLRPALSLQIETRRDPS